MDWYHCKDSRFIYSSLCNSYQMSRVRKLHKSQNTFLIKACLALKSNRSPSRFNNIKRSHGCGTGLRKEAAILLFQAGEPRGTSQHFRSFDLLVKALSQPLRGPSKDNRVITELWKVIEMYLNLGILLSFKDSIVLLQMFGKEVSYNTFMGRGGFLIERDPPKAKWQSWLWFKGLWNAHLFSSLSLTLFKLNGGGADLTKPYCAGQGDLQ